MAEGGVKNWTYFNKTISLCSKDTQPNNYINVFLTIMKHLGGIDLKCVMPPNRVLQIKKIDMKRNPFSFMLRTLSNNEYFIEITVFEEKSPPHEVFSINLWYKKMRLD